MHIRNGKALAMVDVLATLTALILLANAGGGGVACDILIQKYCFCLKAPECVKVRQFFLQEDISST